MAASILDPETLHDGVSFFREARLHRPVYFDEDVEMYIVTRSSDIAAALRESDVFSVMGARGHIPPYSDVVAEVLTAEGFGPFELMLPHVDPPNHSRVRSLVSKGFTAPRVAKLQASIDEFVNELIDRFIDRGRAEVFTELAQPLPLTVIGDLLCVPRERHGEIVNWSKFWIACATGNFADNAEARRAASALADMQRFVAGQLAERRARPADDMMTDLISARSGSEPPLTDREIISVGGHFLAAGNETVSVAVTHAIDMLARDPQRFAALKEADDRAASCRAFVEEVLRYEAPVNAVMRVAAVDTQLGGVTIPEGSKIALMLASANRDQELFGPDADQFRPGRTATNRLMSFGGGVHVCIGSMLARAEIVSVVNAVLRRFDSIRPLNREKAFTDFGRVTWAFNYRLKKLDVEFEPSTV